MHCQSVEYDNYNKQYDVARQLCHEFEKYQNLKNSRKNITDEMQNSHFEQVFELMQKMQGFGNPPSDIVGDFGAVSNGVGANYNVQEKEEKFKAFLEQNGLDSVSGGVQFDAKGMPIFPEELSGTDEKCTISWINLDICEGILVIRKNSNGGYLIIMSS